VPEFGSGILKYLKTMALEICQKRCFFPHDAFRFWSKRLVERWHLLKDMFSDPKVWADRTIRWCVKGFSFSVIMLAESKTHHPISHRPFRLFVVRPGDFYLATKGANARPLLNRRSDFLEPI